MSTPMHTVVKIGHQPHPLNTKKYGRPRFAIYWAKPGVFVYPGIYIWTGKRNWRILPIPRKERR